MEAAEILVIILATAFALFLILAIVLVVILIKVAKQINRITATAERTVSNIENVVSVAQRAVAPAMITKLVSELVGKFTGAKDKRKD